MGGWIPSEKLDEILKIAAFVAWPKPRPKKNHRPRGERESPPPLPPNFSQFLLWARPKLTTAKRARSERNRGERPSLFKRACNIFITVAPANRERTVDGKRLHRAIGLSCVARQLRRALAASVYWSADSSNGDRSCGTVRSNGSNRGRNRYSPAASARAIDPSYPV